MPRIETGKSVLTKRLVYFGLFVLVVLFLRMRTAEMFHAVPIYVISLERLKERRAHIKKELRGYSYTIFDAIDGKNLSHYQESRRDKYILPNTLNYGRTGSFLSHLTIWERIRDGADPCALILEDDFHIVGPVKKMLPKLVTVSGYDVMYVGHYFEPEKGALLHTIGRYKIHKSTIPYCIHAYVVTKQGARILTDYVTEHKVSLPADDVILEIYKKQLIRLVSIYPTLIDQLQFGTTLNE